MEEKETNNGVLTNSELASQVISKYTTTQQNTKRKSEPINKDDEEYTRKRARNNVAVKKSREKAKNRIIETQTRVEQLSQENEELQTKVTLLSKELNVLRALFTNGGFTLPCDLQYLNNGSESDHSSSDSLHTSHHSHATSHLAENSSNYTYSSHFPSTVISNKATSKVEESKIPPLRPMPSRVVNGHGTPPNKSPSESSYSIPGKSFSYTSERDNQFSFKPSNYYRDFIKTTTTGGGISSSHVSSSTPSLPIQPPHSQYNLPQSYKLTETQHTSVIRDAKNLNDDKTSSNSQNTLGKFCIIQDPENNGQVKIVPINV